jgi:hypothetical protein
MNLLTAQQGPHSYSACIDFAISATVQTLEQMEKD